MKKIKKMEQKIKLNWKKFSNTSTFQILFDKENTLFLQNIFSHKLTEFEIENLPSFYIISFVEVLQNYIFYFLKNEQGENGINNVPNECEKLINSQNEKIEELKEKIINFQEVINQKDIALNNTHKILTSIYNRYNQLEQEYQTKIEKLEKELEEKEDDCKFMEDKLIDTFSYLNKFVTVPKIDMESFRKKEKNEIKNKDRSQKYLYSVKTYLEEKNKNQENNVKKQTTLSPNNKKKKIDKNNIE